MSPAAARHPPGIRALTGPVAGTGKPSGLAVAVPFCAMAVVVAADLATGPQVGLLPVDHDLVAFPDFPSSLRQHLANGRGRAWAGSMPTGAGGRTPARPLLDARSEGVAGMASTQGEGSTAPGLAQETTEVLQSATRMLAGVALRSLDVLGSAVTLPQFRLLAVVADMGPMPTGQAARTLGLDRSTVTRLADRMVSAGHVSRGTDPRHRGMVTLELTESGRDLVAAADAWRRAELARIMARLSPSQQAVVTVALDLLVSAAGDDYGVTAHRPVPL
jgi:DNA-binding MarR family transcriptional regulator